MSGVPVGWFRESWRRVDRSLPEIGPPYPKSEPDFALQVGLATLADQQAQGQTLDQKAALGGAISLAIGALPVTVFAAARQDVETPEIVFAAVSFLILLVALVHSVQGLWPRKYRHTPEQAQVRKLAEGDYDRRQLGWAVAVSVEQAVAVNDRILRARVSTVKLVWLFVLFEIGGVVLAVSFHVF